MKLIKKFPDTLTLLFIILSIFVILTSVIPPGEFDRTNLYEIEKEDIATFRKKDFSESEIKQLKLLEGKVITSKKEMEDTLEYVLSKKNFEKYQATILEATKDKETIVRDSYKKVDKNPQGIFALLQAPLKGFKDIAHIIAFVFIVGGAFGIINKTEAITAGLQSIVTLSTKRPAYKTIIIPLVMILFSLAGATFGMSEETIVFIMITVPLALKLGYDSLTGVAMTYVGASVGFAGAFLNPFTIGIAHGIAGIQLFSGWEYRLVVWAFLTFIATVFVVLYARRIQKDPQKSLVYEIDQKRQSQHIKKDTLIPFNRKRKLIILLLFASLTGLVIGVKFYDWYIAEISGLFLGLGLLSGIIYRLKPSKISQGFVEGAKDMIIAALVIAISRGLLIIAKDGRIIDPILNTMAEFTDNFDKAISVQFMFLFQGILNIFIPSGSGQAALTMPIMAPLSDMIGISRQTAVLAFQLGDGLLNMIIPTSGVTMGVLGVAKIPFDKWFKWIFPLMLILIIIAMLLLLPPVLFYNWN